MTLSVLMTSIQEVVLSPRHCNFKGLNCQCAQLKKKLGKFPSPYPSPAQGTLIKIQQPHRGRGLGRGPTDALQKLKLTPLRQQLRIMLENGKA